jgi:Kef-type K+ transport system membrane component KefB/glycine cleavage system regulatory protein
MDFSRILLDLIIVLAAAKLAAEGAERLGVPAVVGEILAGIVIGPSLLGLVGRGDEVLRVLGELGVILLLLDVGLEMDIGELRKVGRASLSVATIGVVVPMVLGIGAMRLMGESGNTALFVGAALTATSVGITARVFGDLRALATSEARIVLGAAVADDVMGLVVLTVVVRLVTEGSVSALSLLGIIGVAVAFLVIGGFAGLRIAPWLFRWVNRLARSSGTLVALAFAFALGFAELADKAKLAPIVGAFVAGLALGRTDSAERIRGELAPVGHLLIPVFFLQIGIDADVSAFGKVSVLRDAGILLAVAVVGKLVAAVGARGASADKLLVGLGMLPRGEVGLIFATIGLANGVLSDELYAALLLVVLATTLMTPPLLKQRSRTVLHRLREAIRARGGGDVAPIPTVVDGEICLPGPVADERALELALRAAVLARSTLPSSDLVTWLAGLDDDIATGWDADERELLLDVVERGNARSWRFLESTGTLDRALPELATAVHRRRSDPMEMDIDGAYRWRALERLRVLDASDPAIEEARRLEHPKRLLVAALLVEALDQSPDPAADARSFATRIGLSPEDREAVVASVEDRHLLWAAARRAGALDETNVRGLAAHLGDAERARATYVLAVLRSDGHDRWETARLRQLHDLVQDTLTREAPDEDTRHLLDQRRSELARLVGDDDRAVARALAAPASFLLSGSPAEAARRLRALDSPPPKGRLRLAVHPGAGADHWMLEIVARDRPGVLAGLAAAITAAGYDIRDAEAATWGDGGAIEIFIVRGVDAPDEVHLEAALAAGLEGPTGAGPLDGVTFAFDDRASPWHTVCEIEADERPGLLADIAAVLRAAGVTVRAARASSQDGRAYDTFELAMTDGRKLDAATEDRIRDLARSGVTLRRRRFRPDVLVAAGANAHP